MALIRKLIYVLVFLFSTISFVVLFQTNWNFASFPDDLQNQIKEIQQMVQGGKKTDKPAAPSRP